MADLLDPLATWQWKEATKFEIRIPNINKPYIDVSDMRIRRSVSLKGKWYVNMETIGYNLNDVLFEFSSDLSTCNMLPPCPSSAPGIATYRNQLVVAGGAIFMCPTDQVWVSNDGQAWNPSLPPMPRRRYAPTLVNTGTPEYLLVVGGEDESQYVETVDVLTEQQWSTVAHLPFPLLSIKHTLHNGYMYLYSQGERRGYIISCNLQTLIARIKSANFDNGEEGLWKVLQNRLFCKLLFCVSVQKNLLCLIHQNGYFPSLCVCHNQSLVTIGTGVDGELPPRVNSWGLPYPLDKTPRLLKVSAR